MVEGTPGVDKPGAEGSHVGEVVPDVTSVLTVSLRYKRCHVPCKSSRNKALTAGVLGMPARGGVRLASSLEMDQIWSLRVFMPPTSFSAFAER